MQSRENRVLRVTTLGHSKTHQVRIVCVYVCVSFFFFMHYYIVFFLVCASSCGFKAVFVFDIYVNRIYETVYRPYGHNALL
jgi:hypothetical protein